MREARQYQREERWPDAAMALERAEGRLANGGPPHLRDRVEEMRRDAAMVARLEEARLVASNIQKGMRDYGAADGAYEAAFDDYGLGLEALGAEEAAQRVRDSAIAP